MTVVRDMKMVLKSTNDNAVAGEKYKLQALKKLKEFIEFHAIMKELSVVHCKTGLYGNTPVSDHWIDGSGMECGDVRSRPGGTQCFLQKLSTSFSMDILSGSMSARLSNLWSASEGTLSRRSPVLTHRE